MREGRCQAAVVNGESGAGKTETTKHLLHYLSEHSAVNAAASELSAQLLASNPILEAFGNARTLRNDNSSRFGKLVKLHFDEISGSLTHASVAHYLLEKSRVTHQQQGEQVCVAENCTVALPSRGAWPPELRYTVRRLLVLFSIQRQSSCAVRCLCSTGLPRVLPAVQWSA
jgi:hypothetical protein